MVFNFQNQEQANLVVRPVSNAVDGFHGLPLRPPRRLRTWPRLHRHPIDRRYPLLCGSRSIHRERTSCMSFVDIFEIGIEAICMDYHVLERAIHLPAVGSSYTAQFPAPFNVQIGQAGAPGSSVITFTDYADFNESYRGCLLHLPLPRDCS